MTPRNPFSSSLNDTCQRNFVHTFELSLLQGRLFDLTSCISSVHLLPTVPAASGERSSTRPGLTLSPTPDLLPALFAARLSESKAPLPSATAALLHNKRLFSIDAGRLPTWGSTSSSHYPYRAWLPSLRPGHTTTYERETLLPVPTGSATRPTRAARSTVTLVTPQPRYLRACGLPILAYEKILSMPLRPIC